MLPFQPESIDRFLTKIHRQAGGREQQQQQQLTESLQYEDKMFIIPRQKPVCCFRVGN